MSIKVEVSKGVTPVKPKYPFLGVHNDGTVIMFTSDTEGTVLKGKEDGTNEYYSVGTHRDDWIMSTFDRFHGSVTITSD